MATNSVYPPQAGSDLQTKAAAVQLFVGEAPIIAGTATSTAAITQYQLCAILAAGTIAPYVDADHEPNQAVVASIAASAGSKQVTYYNAGHFNHEAITWPAEYDTFAKRKGFLIGTPLNVGKLLPADS